MRFLLVLLTLLIAAPASAGMEDEARRQLDFAQTELDAGSFEKALKSAQSAYRLDPTAHRALVLLGLAYEGLGDLARARSFLETCTSLAAGTAAAKDAAVALERVNAQLEESRSGKRNKPSKAAKQSFDEQVAAALAARRCKDAADLASQWTDKKPQNPRAWEQLGGALACLADSREAVHAYRKARDLGSTSSTLPFVIKGLEAELANLELAITWPDGAPKVEPRLLIAGLDPLAPDDGTTWTDLPAGPARLGFGGAGWAGVVDLPTLEPGRTTKVDVDAPWLGIGTLEIGETDRDVRVVVLVAGEEKPLVPGRKVDVTAGEVTILVHGADGTVEQTVEVPAGSTVTFEPNVFKPTRLVVRNVPTGSTLRLFVESAEGAAIERSLVVPRGIGVVNNTAGIPLAAEVAFSDAIAGSGGLFVLHPLLGEGAAEVDVLDGQDNVIDFDWRGMPGVPDIQTQYEFFQAGTLEGPKTVDGGVVASAIISAALGAGAGALLGASFAEEAALPGKHSVYRATVLTGDATATRAAYDEWDGSRLRVEQLRWAGLGLGGGAVVGLGITVVAGATSKGRVKKPEWEPDGF
jgi:Flp pilus assembly protein TadD